MEKKIIPRDPTIIIPFSGACQTSLCQDVFVYLRPESNGIAVESALMKGVSNVPDWQNNINLVYLANLPGDFLNEKGVFEEHYQTRIKFAKRGKSIFTPFMGRNFSNHYKVDFEKAEIIGSYKALALLGLNEDELFKLWVDEEDMFIVNGQIIKRIGKYYVVNSDIPSILNKNNSKTDIAVMIFQTIFWGRDFYNVILNMTKVLLEEGILHSESQFNHVFHYSKGPFEQILDAVGFLYDTDGNHLPLQNIRFYNFLLEKGLSIKAIDHFIRQPLFQFKNDQGNIEEKSIFHVTKDLSYEDSWEILKSATAQVLL
ncbi:MAG: hypothetical protein PF693_03360 [Spirochaetia bacterium]|jgi:hypothetical protein|nr:hypothetical protein [Spirochaetia bacterium]